MSLLSSIIAPTNVLTAQANGTLAVAKGGTGLSAPGTAGNVLTSTGTAWTSSPAISGLTYILLNNTNSPYTVLANQQLAINTTAGAVTLVAPAAGNFSVADTGSNADLNNIVINFAAKNLVFQGTTYTTFNHDLNNAKLVFVDDGTNYRVFG